MLLFLFYGGGGDEGDCLILLSLERFSFTLFTVSLSLYDLHNFFVYIQFSVILVFYSNHHQARIQGGGGGGPRFQSEL